MLFLALPFLAQFYHEKKVFSLNTLQYKTKNTILPIAISTLIKEQL